MFADSLLDSHFTGRAQRGWTTLTSFALQMLAVAGVLMLPLLYTEGLPKLLLVSAAPIGPPPGAPPCTVCVPGATGPSSTTNSIINSIGTEIPVVTPAPPTAHPPRISHMMEGN